MKPAIWAAVARPLRISLIAARACRSLRSTPLVIAPSTPGHPPAAAKASSGVDPVGAVELVTATMYWLAGDRSALTPDLGAVE